MKSSVKGKVVGNEFILMMDSKIESLRREIWKAIYKNKGELSECDISLALGIVNYELVHHIGE